MTASCATLSNNTNYYQNERIISQRVLKNTCLEYRPGSSIDLRVVEKTGVDLLERVSEINGKRVSYLITPEGGRTNGIYKLSPKSSAFAGFLAGLVCLIMIFLLIFL
jgi:hypothetical protein